jgi:hypothetical protein
MSVGRAGSRGPARAVLCFALLALVAALAACASKSKPKATPAAPAPGTTTVAFSAYTPAGALAVKVQDVVRGQCWTASIAAPAADAYRCFQGNKILDPCFAPKHRSSPVQLACVDAPWDRAVMLQVTGRLPAPAPHSAARPWAIELANGVRCIASTGTVPAVGGVNLGFHCADGGDAALSGVQGSMLAARYAAAGATTLTTTGVRTIWNT